MQKLDKKINLYYLIFRTIFCSIIYGGFIVLLLLNKKIMITELRIAAIILASIIVLFLIIGNFITPFFIYKLSGYIVNEDSIIVKTGVIFRTNEIVPLKRIQHIEKIQGPIQILLNQATLQIYTAGSVVSLVGLTRLDADKLLDDLNKKLNLYLENNEEEK